MRELFEPGAPVVLYLVDPKEKVWGLLGSIGAAGVTIRGMSLDTFEDWMRQEAKEADEQIGLVALYYPLTRIERMERDESIGLVAGYADRFARQVGRTVHDALGRRRPESAEPRSSSPAPAGSSSKLPSDDDRYH
jgi:hypothetical protein